MGHQEPWHKGSREAVSRQERHAAAMVAGKAREQENSCLAAIELAHTCKVASGISLVLVSCFLAAHARVNLPGIVAPLLVDEPVQPPDWDSDTSREAVERRTICPSEAAGCWEGSEGGESDEERGDCTPAWSPSEAAAAASAASADILHRERRQQPQLQRAEVLGLRLQRPRGDEGADAQTFREGRQRNIILGRKNTSSVFTSFVLW